MDIIWYGQACFRIREMGVTAITEPFGKNSLFALSRVRADIVTLSGANDGDGYLKGIRGSPRLLQMPGEYEIGGVFVTGLSAWSESEGRRERNIIFLYDLGGVTVCHLGLLKCVPTQSQVEALDGVHVLLAPIDGPAILSVEQMAEVIGLFEPGLVIPMHYDRSTLPHNPAALERFLKTMGVDQASPQDMLKVGPGAWPDDTQVVLLECKQ